jgi:hypothetical protein
MSTVVIQQAPSSKSSSGEGVRIKVKCVSKEGPEWEKYLMENMKLKVMLTINKNELVVNLKEKIEEKFRDKHLNSLNEKIKNDPALAVHRIASISGLKATSLCTPDGYDIDDENTLADYFGEGELEMACVSNISLTSVPMPAPECCTIS